MTWRALCVSPYGGDERERVHSEEVFKLVTKRHDEENSRR
jgi:hypothetical protein